MDITENGILIALGVAAIFVIGVIATSKGHGFRFWGKTKGGELGVEVKRKRRERPVSPEASPGQASGNIGDVDVARNAKIEDSEVRVNIGHRVKSAEERSE